MGLHQSSLSLSEVPFQPSSYASLISPRPLDKVSRSSSLATRLTNLCNFFTWSDTCDVVDRQVWIGSVDEVLGGWETMLGKLSIRGYCKVE